MKEGYTGETMKSSGNSVFTTVMHHKKMQLLALSTPVLRGTGIKKFKACLGYTVIPRQPGLQCETLTLKIEKKSNPKCPL